MPIQLKAATRVARKEHRCGMCNAVIKVGESHYVSTNLFDGRVYDWRDCEACQRDGILAEVYDWAGMPDEGVNFESAWEWAHESAASRNPEIARMAADYLRRCACTCERCEQPTPAPTTRVAPVRAQLAARRDEEQL